ncbi:MAG: hypothetical protein ACLU6W_10015 [Lachnospiraceae bacterium]
MTEFGFCGKERQQDVTEQHFRHCQLREREGTRDILESVLSARGFELNNFQKISQFESIP